MNAAVLEPRVWSPARRWSGIALVFAVQIGLLLALSDRRAVPPRPPAPALVVSLAPEASELLALNDPTLFALPQRSGLAGAAWLQVPDVPFQPFRWTEPPRLLSLRLEELGAAFAQFMGTNRFAGLAFETKLAPELPPPVAPEIGVPQPTSSTLRVAGDLVNRPLLNPPELPSLGATNLLTNTVVQVLVNAEGAVFSPTLLSRSLDPAADQRALELARAARFQPLREAAPALTLGVLVFEWHTVPPTNAPAAGP